MKNWRPISQINSLAKILERVNLIRLNKDIANKNPNVFDNQFGFIAGRSTLHPLSIVLNDINHGMSNKKITSMIALDLQSAFDTIWREALIFKLFSLRVNLFINRVINNFLRDRSFSVLVGSSLSHLIVTCFGIPQGSVLSPTLFNIFIYDLPKHLMIKMEQLADDILLHLTHSDPESTVGSLNQYLRKIKFFLDN